MKPFSQKNSIVALLVSVGVMFSVNANAEQPSIESTLTKAVLEQTQLVMKELSVELQKSIAEEIKSFSIDHALVWLAPESEHTARVINNKKENSIIADE